MKRFLKWSLGVFGLVILVLLAYLIYDVPFPPVDTGGMTHIDAKDIPDGAAEHYKGDSLSKNIHADGKWFKDPSGRTMILHGINLSGSSKNPYKPLINSNIKEGFLESAYVISFTGRPFPISEADQHFGRLHRWGYRFIRLVVTWEALEHAGPGQYDEEYIAYIKAICQKAAEYRINVFIDPHQDVWSRFTGGDGAPYWTLEVVGINPLHLQETGAAVVHNLEGDPFPKMLWPTNYWKTGASTMFALFYGSEDFAPGLRVHGVSAQEFLQSHYVDAMVQLARSLKGLPNVVGFEVMNEPTAGLIGAPDLNALGILKNGAMPTPFQGMVAAAGIPVEVPYYQFEVPTPTVKGNVKLNPNGVSLWKHDSLDVWRNAGVWRVESGTPVLKHPNHFSEVRGRQVDFSTDYYRPFVNRYAKAIQSIDSTWLVFVEHPSMHRMPRFTNEEARQLVHASHSYDAVTLLTKEYNSWFNIDTRTIKIVFGRRAIREMFHDQLREFKDETEESMGLRPTLLGEFGVPMDLAEKKAYQSRDYSDQNAALDRVFRPLESNMISYALWDYTPDNDHAHGDQWNGEDLSIFSRDGMGKNKEMDGGRALDAALRAYPFKVAGEPQQYFFDMHHKKFYLRYKSDPLLQAPTEVFLPNHHFGKGFTVHHSPGKLTYDREQQLLLYYPSQVGIVELVVEAQP